MRDIWIFNTILNTAEKVLEYDAEDNNLGFLAYRNQSGMQNVNSVIALVTNKENKKEKLINFDKRSNKITIITEYEDEQTDD